MSYILELWIFKKKLWVEHLVSQWLHSFNFGQLFCTTQSHGRVPSQHRGSCISMYPELLLNFLWISMCSILTSANEDLVFQMAFSLAHMDRTTPRQQKAMKDGRKQGGRELLAEPGALLFIPFPSVSKENKRRKIPGDIWQERRGSCAATWVREAGCLALTAKELIGIIKEMLLAPGLAAKELIEVRMFVQSCYFCPV